MAILVNGIEGCLLDPSDRGLAFGDGVFRTLRLDGRQPIWWNRHYRKLACDCEVIGLSCPAGALLRNEVQQAAGELAEAAVKIIVTRGAGPRGYAPPPAPSPNRIVSVGPLPTRPRGFWDEGVQVRRCDLRLGFQPRLAGTKHLNRLENVLARMEWRDPGIAEGLLLDLDGNVIEGVASNVFAVVDRVLCTPDLSRCGVSGVTRERVIEAAAASGAPVQVRELNWDELMDADEVLLVNSLIGAWQVRECDGRRWPQGPSIARIRAWLEETED